MSETRKLAAILVADVVGYSRLAGADEDRTLARLRGLRSDLIDPAIAAHHGRIVKRTGDGIVIEFRSVVDAVRCALEVQTGMVERNAGLPPERRIEFRVGIHLGDVVEEADGDLMGDGVNVAARLEGIAKPGTICLSEDAYRQVRSRLDLAVTDLGQTQLKNIAEPVRVYSLQVGVPAPKKRSALAALSVVIAALLVVMAAGAWYMLGANRPATEAPNATALSASLSIVVLPFANLSGDASQDYVADAIGEELTTALSRLKNSFVIARTTALTYKGKYVDVKQIGKELGVRYVLEGSAQRVGDRVRVTAQLIDAETGAHLWADQFDQPRADLLEMQDEIVTRLGRALDLQLTEADVARNQRLRPGNLDAEDLALRCRSEWQQFFYDAAKVQAAYGLCDQALKLDERNVTALGMLAFKWILPVLFLKSADPASDIRQADDFVSRALAVDAADPMAHLVRAWIFDSQGNFEAQQVEAERIISTNPSDILAYIAECNAFNQLGRAEEAIECSDQALRLSPRDPFASDFLFQKGFAQLLWIATISRSFLSGARWR
jgi:adenylate cyclase